MNLYGNYRNKNLMGLLFNITIHNLIIPTVQIEEKKLNFVLRVVLRQQQLVGNKFTVIIFNTYENV